MDNNVYVLKNYGKIEITLKEVLEKKDISRNKLCTMIATNYDLVNRYYNNKVIRIFNKIELNCKEKYNLEKIIKGYFYNII